MTVCLVTGGGGFVGKALCLRLKRDGHRVISLARGNYPELQQAGIECVQADLSSNPKSYERHFAGVDVVFHTASKVDMWGRYKDFLAANVIGTRNVIECCRKHGVKRLVYTSSPSVIADGHDHRGIGESYPYPARHAAYYPATKAIAEREVLAANDANLFTVALRPHLIWGPGDRHFVPAILDRARAGRMVRIGQGQNVVDLCYIDDCVEAHVLAMQRLLDNPQVRGQAYFITQGDPVKFWEWVDKVLVANGLPKITRSVPKGVAFSLAWIFEGISRLCPWQMKPLFTRFLVSQMTCDHWFSIEKARRELGYKPSLTVEQGLASFGSLTSSNLLESSNPFSAEEGSPGL